MTTEKRTLTVKSLAQRVLLENELLGQISDGMWENATPHNHYKAWNCEVVVGEHLGRNFWACKDNYDFASKTLRDIVGGRMMVAVRLAKAYGIGNVSTLAYLFDDDKYTGMPSYQGKYWDGVREKITAIISREQLTPEIVAQVGQDESLYNSKQLLADLKELKTIVKIRNAKC